MKKAVVYVDSKGRVSLPEWVWKRLLKMSGSRAKSNSGQRRAIRKMFHKLLYSYVEGEAQTAEARPEGDYLALQKTLPGWEKKK